MSLENILERPPDFINEKQTKWWLDKSLTAYARKKLGEKNAVFRIELSDGHRSFVLVEDRELTYESITLDGMACYLDARGFIK